MPRFLSFCEIARNGHRSGSFIGPEAIKQESSLDDNSFFDFLGPRCRPRPWMAKIPSYKTLDPTARIISEDFLEIPTLSLFFSINSKLSCSHSSHQNSDPRERFQREKLWKNCALAPSKFFCPQFLVSVVLSVVIVELLF